MELHRSAAAVAALAARRMQHRNLRCLAAAPPIVRTPMAPRRWGRVGPLSWMLRRLFGLELRPADVDGPARGAGHRRRFVLLALSLGPALYATYVLYALLPNVVTANETLDTAIAWGQNALLVVFALLTCWIAAGFWTAMMGFCVLLRGGDRHLISRSAVPAGATLPCNGAHGDRDADLQRRRASRICRFARDLRVGRARRCAGSLRLLRPVGHRATPTCAWLSSMRGTRCAKNSVPNPACSIATVAAA